MALARSVSVKLRAEVAEYVAGLNKAAGATKEFKTELNEAAKKGNLDAVVSGTTAAGLALSGAFALAATAAATFDKQMSEVASVSNATGRDLESLRSAALHAGKDTAFSATEAAKAEAELAKAGLSSSEILGGALTGALSLAAAGQMDLADAATITAKTLNMFQLNGSMASHVADVLASAANTSAADMHDLGLGLNQVGLVAHDAGLSLEETVGVLAAFADRGLEGSDGATSLKTAIQRLTAPTAEAKTLMDGLGISVYDANGHVHSAADLAGNLQSSLGRLSDEERNAALATIFGSDAIRAANVLYTIGSDGVRRYTDQVDQQGAASETAAKKTDNLAGDIERLKGSIETMAIEAGSGANGGLRALVQVADGALSVFGSLPDEVQTTATVLAGVAGAGLLATGGLLKVKQTAHDALEQLSAVGPMGEKAATGIGKIGAAAGKLTVLGAVAFGLYEGLNALIHASDRLVESHNLDKVSEGLVRFANSGRASGEAAKIIGSSFNDFADKYTRAITAVGSADTGKVRQAEKDIEDLDAGFAKMVEGGYTVQAKTLVDQFTQSMLSQGFTLDQINSVYLPQYNEAAADAAAGNTGLAKGFGSAESAARTLAGGLQESINAGKTLKQTFDELNGGQINLTQAQINAEAAVDGLTEALLKSEGQLDMNTVAGRAAAQAAVDLATKGRDVAQATFEQSHNAEQARGVFEAYRQQLIDNIATAGGTKQATDQSRAAAKLLADQIMQMPEFKKIPISLPGIDTAIEKVIGLQTHLSGLKDRSVTVTTIQNTQTGQTRTSVHQSQRFERYGGVHYAADGLLDLDGVAAAWGPGETLYGFRERGTGGEAFVARNAPDGPSLHYADVAAQWHGGRVVTDSMLAALIGARQAPAASGNTFAIEHFHANTGQSPHRIAEDLWFLTTARGGA